MKLSVSVAFRNFILNRIAKTYARCWRVSTKYGQTYGYTSHTRNIVIGATTYQSSLGLQSSDMLSSDAFNPDNVNISAFLEVADDALISAGVFDNAVVEVFVVNYLDLSMEPITLKTGYVGEISRSDGIFSMELRSLTQVLDTKIGEVFSTSCQADLGDIRCKVNLFPITHSISCSIAGAPTNQITRLDSGSFLDDGYDVNGVLVISNSITANNIQTDITTVTASVITVADNLTTAGTNTITLTQQSNLSQSVSVVAVSSPRRSFTLSLAFNDSFLNQGRAEFTSGANTGFRRDIRVQVADLVTTSLPFPYDIEIGDNLVVTAGCDKLRSTCKDKFDNLINIRAFPDVPVAEDVFNSPVVAQTQKSE